MNALGVGQLRIAAVLLITATAVAVAGFRAAPASASAGPSCSFYVWTADGPYQGDLNRTSQTSCPFARNVFRAVIGTAARAGGAGDGYFTVRAHSPVTSRTYRMRCLVNGNLYGRQGLRAVCHGGIGAAVAFRAWSV